MIEAILDRAFGKAIFERDAGLLARVVRLADARKYDQLSADFGDRPVACEWVPGLHDLRSPRGKGICRFVCRFGAYAETQVDVFVQGEDYGEALECAADYLAEHAPGHLSTEESMKECWPEVDYEAGEEFPDAIYTDSGYLASWEVSMDLEGAFDFADPRDYAQSGNGDPL